MTADQTVGVAETTRERLRELAGQAADEGWSPADFAARLEETGLFGPERAALVARTEAASAMTRGSLLYYKESGVVKGTEWLLGPSPCPECQSLGGRVVPLGEEFADGVAGPPKHPNCRCAIAPRID